MVYTYLQGSQGRHEARLAAGKRESPCSCNMNRITRILWGTLGLGGLVRVVTGGGGGPSGPEPASLGPGVGPTVPPPAGDTKTGFFSRITGFFSRNSREKSGMISFGKLRRARRAALEASPRRDGPHWSLPGFADAHMVGGSWQV